jgi:hypothetical protein
MTVDPSNKMTAPIALVALANEAQSEWAAREMQMSDFIPRAGSLRPSAGTSGYRSLGLALKETPIGSLAWRAPGQAALIYLTIGASAVTAQDTQPGRTTFAEMIAFARLGSVACERVVPDAEGFHALALQRFINPPLTEKEISAKEKDVKRLRDRLGLNGWCKRYAGKMEQARILVQVLRRKN